MENLLVEILKKARSKNIEFRYSAEELENYDCDEFIAPWGYDINKVIDTFNKVDIEGVVEFQHDNGETGFIIWEPWNEDADCLNCYDDNLDEWLGLSALVDKWEDDFLKWKKGLLKIEEGK